MRRSLAEVHARPRDHHPNVCRVYDIGEAGFAAPYPMELSTVRRAAAAAPYGRLPALEGSGGEAAVCSSAPLMTGRALHAT